MSGPPDRLPVRAGQRLQVCFELPGSFNEVCLLRPLYTKSVKEVSVEVYENLCTFGNPHILQSDNGREFANAVVKKIKNWPGCKAVKQDLNAVKQDVNAVKQDVNAIKQDVNAVCSRVSIQQNSYLLPRPRVDRCVHESVHSTSSCVAAGRRSISAFTRQYTTQFLFITAAKG